MTAIRAFKGFAQLCDSAINNGATQHAAKYESRGPNYVDLRKAYGVPYEYVVISAASSGSIGEARKAYEESMVYFKDLKEARKFWKAEVTKMLEV